MTIQRLSCPSCGGPLEPAPDVIHVTCVYCGTALLIAGSGVQRQTNAGSPRAAQAPQVSPAANVSLAFGVLAWFLLPLVGAIAAVIFGHTARRDIAAAQGALTGEERALMGLALGYAQLGLVALAIIGQAVSGLV